LTKPRPARTHGSVAEEDLTLPVIYSMSVSLDGFKTDWRHRLDRA